MGIQRHIAFFQSLDSAEIYLFGWAWFYMLKLALARKLDSKANTLEHSNTEVRQLADSNISRNVHLAVSRASRYHLIYVSPGLLWQTKVELQKKITKESLQ